tara:strand:+ start:13476 stop:18116 length:4641 start_codon:yes stop_codon:yes gene_type:complete
MATFTQDITKPFSRMGNGLVELQRWFPVYIKNDGVGGISVDPVLYRTGFGALTQADEGGLNDESNTAGVRVEVIDDDGSTMAGTYTLTISGSGTHTPLAEVNYNGTAYNFMLLAPSAPNTVAGNAALYGVSSQAGNLNKAGAPLEELDHTPTMVFMTVQEFAEMLDTYRHIGATSKDATKPAWLPHGLIGRVVSTSTANPLMNADPRLSSSGLNKVSALYGNQHKVRATVFMPMMLDNNQFDKRIPQAQTRFSYPRNNRDSNFTGYGLSGITRYDSRPTGSDGVKYKEVGYSGDHLTGAVGAWSLYKDETFTANSTSHTVKSVGGTKQQTMGYSNADTSMDSAAASNPKYRMRMALACFLKDGTYTLNAGGTIVPYIYDSNRTIGGVNSTTLYAVWDGKNGYGNSQPVADDCDAQIYPMFDFVQAPLAPASQGNNFDMSVNELEHTNWPDIVSSQTIGSNNSTQPRQFLVRPNPVRVEIFGITKSTNGTLTVYINSTTSHYFVGAHGMPVYMTGITGKLGTGTNNPNTRWNALDDDGWQDIGDSGSGTVSGNDLNHNGWWILDSVSDVVVNGVNILGQTTYQVLTIRVGHGIFGGAGQATYATTGYVCQGRIGGAEMQSDTVPLNLYGITQSWKTANLVQGTGTGFVAGLSQPDSTTPAGASTDSTYPARPVLYEPQQPDAQGVYTSGADMVCRSISIRADTDETFATAPTMSSVGGGVLRIPPAVGWDLARVYYSSSKSVQTSGVTPDSGFVNSPNTLNGAPNARWGFRGINVPFWSYIDSLTGRHGWDYTKPNGWAYGRNRPYPAFQRIGTRTAYSPSLFADASAGGWNVAASTNKLQSGIESIKVGLSEMACSPIWLDMEIRAFIPVQKNRLVMIEFDNGVSYGKTGRHSMMTHGGTNNFLQGHGFYSIWDGDGIQHHPTATGSNLYGQAGQNPSYTVNRPSVWTWGTGTDFFTAAWSDSQADVFPNMGASGTAIGGNNGWGNLGNGYGYGTPKSLVEGTHTIRTVFTEGGMEYILDGVSQGIDINSATAVWGMTIKIGDSLALGASGITNNQGQSVFTQRPNMNVSQSDLQIDEIVLRQIPTKPMLPFNVDTMKQQISNVAKYNSLDVEVNNVDESKGMNITATLLEPPTTTQNGIQIEASTVITGYQNVDLDILSGIGSIDLTNLPTSALTNGFVVRFNFWIPDNTQTEYHPIDWNKIPIVRNWSINYDLKPVATLTCTGNTFSSDITSPVATKIGNILSFNIGASTPDSDRKISSVKIDFGDGSVSGWLDVADQTLTSTTYDVSHVYTSAGSLSAKAYVKDDNGNESIASNIIVVVPAEGLPVAVLRGSPALIYAGQDVTLDASSSYLVSTTSGITIVSYIFNSGISGATPITQSGSTLQVTYATAGEYAATLQVKDNQNPVNTSATATVILKVLPTNIAVDLLGNLNTRPSGFNAQRSANLSSVPLLDSEYPDVTDMGTRDETFTLTGSFLKATATPDILQMETYISAGTLLYIEWETTNFSGASSVQRFTGRMVDFDYEREGGMHGETPYTATFQIAS